MMKEMTYIYILIKKLKIFAKFMKNVATRSLDLA